MARVSVYFHINPNERMKIGYAPDVINLSSLTIFLPVGVDATPIIDAFNTVMRSRKTVAAPRVRPEDEEVQF